MGQGVDCFVVFAAGTLTTEGKVVEVVDKKSGALILVESE